MLAAGCVSLRVLLEPGGGDADLLGNAVQRRLWKRVLAGPCPPEMAEQTQLNAKTDPVGVRAMFADHFQIGVGQGEKAGDFLWRGRQREELLALGGCQKSVTGLIRHERAETLCEPELPRQGAKVAIGAVS